MKLAVQNSSSYKNLGLLQVSFLSNKQTGEETRKKKEERQGEIKSWPTFFAI